MVVECCGDRPRPRGRVPLARKVEELVRRERLFESESGVLVMVSGGQDSLALLDLLRGRSGLKEGPGSVHALHVNHHLRGEESDADETLVRERCGTLDVGLTVVHKPVLKQRGNVQEVAREARRAAALAVAAELGCDRIALGHTADDQVETMLYRMGRYGGLAALSGMKARDLPWVRPLLTSRRQETGAYCLERGLEFALDRGNAYPGYARTGIRERVLPAWEAVLPGALGAAARTAEVAAEAEEALAGVLAEARRTAGVTWSGPAASEQASGVSAAGLLSLPQAVRRLLLHEWLEARAQPAAARASVLAVEALLAVPGSAERSLGGGWRALKEYDHVFLVQGRRARVAPPPPAELPVPGRVEWGEVVVTAELVDGFRAPDEAREVFVDADRVRAGLEVRGSRPGDRLRPLGAPGTRKLKDILVDRKVPERERARRPLVVCGEQIVWVCGLAVAESARITRDTERFVRLSLTARQGGDGSLDQEPSA
jgi:tRNA(Ile)-lysidine synthase